MSVVTDQFAYIHMPKTGGTWVSNVLKRRREYVVLGNAHDPLSELPTALRPSHLVFGTVRDPWSWYLSWWQHALAFRPSALDQMAGTFQFPDVLYAATHPKKASISPAFGIFFPLRPPEADHRTSWLTSGVGLYTWLVRHMYGNPFAVDALVDTAQLHVGLSELLGEPLDTTQWPPVNTRHSRNSPVTDLRTCYVDPKLVQWVWDADGEMAAYLGYSEPFSQTPTPVRWFRSRA